MSQALSAAAHRDAENTPVTLAAFPKDPACRFTFSMHRATRSYYIMLHASDGEASAMRGSMPMFQCIQSHGCGIASPCLFETHTTL